MNKNTRVKKVESFNRPPGDFLKTKPANLILEDGKVFSGEMPAWQEDSDAAEVVFNNGMTGYVESLTDPSYSEQILTFTYPLIGNYGVHEKGWESEKIHAKGVVVSSLVNDWSHPQSAYSFLSWLSNQNVPIIQNVDTRALTRHLRTKGVENGYIVSNTTMRNFKINTPLVSIHKPKLYKTKGATKTVVLIDCGAKENIVRSLQERKLNVLRVPYDYRILNEKYDGVILSNGPGDPRDYQASIETIKRILKDDKPIFGICLGSQLMSLAAGAKTYKLKFGHRGHNQPCRNMRTGKCYITSQNHGYAVKAKTLPKDWEVYFYNLNDGSVEGIIHRDKPFFSVQFHPEACPGPTDTSFLFDKFVEAL
ncbi:MAG TPA: glutamine-hydrolyzing carbamoyl-phosphate synthase small subunit [Candidatus Saccharimonadales bacterium]|nr:glutamine-hydrolyzing carbamoyl-phosphate synthase small subunit [Candidatus Saccharimonadales bacterium]